MTIREKMDEMQMERFFERMGYNYKTLLRCLTLNVNLPELPQTQKVPCYKTNPIQHHNSIQLNRKYHKWVGMLEVKMTYRDARDFYNVAEYLYKKLKGDFDIDFKQNPLKSFCNANRNIELEDQRFNFDWMSWLKRCRCPLRFNDYCDLPLDDDSKYSKERITFPWLKHLKSKKTGREACESIINTFMRFLPKNYKYGNKTIKVINTSTGKERMI